MARTFQWRSESSVVHYQSIQRLPQVDINPDWVAKAIKQMSTGKAPGPDAIPTEVFKSDGPSLLHKLTALFQSFWESETLPQKFKDVTTVHIHKSKGNKRSCDNHRGISLLSIAGKILDRELLNHLLKHLEQGHLPESQCAQVEGLLI